MNPYTEVCALIRLPQSQPLNPQALFASLWAASFPPRALPGDPGGLGPALATAALRSGPRGEERGEEWTRVRLQLVELRQAWKLLRFLVPTRAKSDT